MTAPATPITIHLTLTLDDLPGVTAQQIRDALSNVLDDSAFTVTGEGLPSNAVTPHDMGRLASQLLSGVNEIDPFEDALSAVREQLYEQSKKLRVESYAADPDQAQAGWASDRGHTKHGRLKPY